jgi:hypothetical protein
MKSAKLILLLFFLAFVGHDVNAQRKGYVLIDGAYFQGYLNYSAEIHDADSVGFAKALGVPLTYYTPDQLMEYGLNGKVFISKEIDKTRKFLEQLAIGNNNLFLTKFDGEKTFFYEHNNNLVRLTKNHYQDSLRNIYGANQELADRVDLVRFRKNDMARYVSYSNEGTYTYFPYRRLGFVLGNSSRILKFEYRGFTPSMNNYLGIVAGAFLDTPIEVYTKWSLRIELMYIAHKYTLVEENPFIRRDYNVKLHSINLPLLIRYRSYGSRIIPFYEMGAAVGFNSTASIDLKETTFNNGQTSTEELQLDIIDRKDLGLIAGLGLDYQFRYDKTLGLALRYQFNFGMEGRSDHRIQDIQLLLSFSF